MSDTKQQVELVEVYEPESEKLPDANYQFISLYWVPPMQKNMGGGYWSASSPRKTRELALQNFPDYAKHRQILKVLLQVTGMEEEL